MPDDTTTPRGTVRDAVWWRRNEAALWELAESEPTMHQRLVDGQVRRVPVEACWVARPNDPFDATLLFSGFIRTELKAGVGRFGLYGPDGDLFGVATMVVRWLGLLVRDPTWYRGAVTGRWIVGKEARRYTLQPLHKPPRAYCYGMPEVLPGLPARMPDLGSRNG